MSSRVGLWPVTPLMNHKLTLNRTSWIMRCHSRRCIWVMDYTGQLNFRCLMHETCSLSVFGPLNPRIIFFSYNIRYVTCSINRRKILSCNYFKITNWLIVYDSTFNSSFNLAGNLFTLPDISERHIFLFMEQIFVCRSFGVLHIQIISFNTLAEIGYSVSVPPSSPLLGCMYRWSLLPSTLLTASGFSGQGH